jgi:hypothetical protein
VVSQAADGGQPIQCGAIETLQLRKDGMGETSLARIAWNREQTILSDERTNAKAIRLTRGLKAPTRKQ